MNDAIPRSARIARRRLLQGGLGLGALAGLGLSGCSNEGRGSATSGDSSSVVLPDFIPYEGVALDREGLDGVSDMMLTYPANPMPSVTDPPGDGDDIGLFAMTTTPAPPGVNQNDYWQELHELLGFSLDIQLVPTGDFSDRFQTAVAGDQLPDIFSFFDSSAPGLPGLLAERATDLTEYLSGGAVADYPFLANIPTRSWQSTVYGGKIYAVPIPRGPQSSSVLLVRQDMLEDLDIPWDVSSLDDFHTMCAEIAATDSNRWALTGAPMPFVRQMFDIPNGWSEEGGHLTSSVEHEGQQEALEAARRLMAAELVHPDTFSSTDAQRKTWVVNGTTPLISATLAGWSDFSNYPISEDFRMAVVAPPYADGSGQAPIWLGRPSHNLTSISTGSASRVEALLDFLNYLAAPFGTAEHLFKNYGLEGVHHERKDGDPVRTEKGRSEIQLGLRYVAEGPWVIFSAGSPDVAESEYNAQSEIIPSARPDPVEGLYSETQSRLGGQLAGALNDLENAILLGREPVSAWTEGVEAWKSGGGEDIRSEFEQALAERQQ